MELKPIERWGFGGPSETVIRHHDGPIEHKTPFYTPESKVLRNAKNMIDAFYAEGKWDDYKKITNPHEYIFLSWNRRTSRSVATRQPLSRSYFKMIELWKCANITDSLRTLVQRDGGLLTAHAAEGPGGFIEACTVKAEANSWTYKDATAITLLSTERHVPGWRKAVQFLEEHPCIEIHDGEDGTGDILKEENRSAFIAKVFQKNPKGVHLYTADGGFDFSSDFNAQEDTILPLLFAEVLIGLQVLTQGGILIIKCFDMTEQSTIDIVYLMSLCFHSWGIVKPCTSRAANAERYFVGKGFLGNVDDIIQTLKSYIAAGDYNRAIVAHQNTQQYKHIATLLYEFQCEIEHAEINVINSTLDLIKTTDPKTIRRLVRDNVIRSIQWCEAHDEPVASFWLSDLDKNVNKECADLLSLLQTPPPVSLAYARQGHVSTFSFAGFRDGTMNSNPIINNPFQRKGVSPFHR